MENGFNVETFLEGLNQDKSRGNSGGLRLQKVWMNSDSTRGTVTFLPVRSNELDNFYVKLPEVYEFYGDTSLLDGGEGRYKILPKYMYPDLTEEESAIYDEVIGYIKTLRDGEHVTWKICTVRTYSLFCGYGLNHVLASGGKNKDTMNAPCLYIFPSNKPIDTLNNAIASKLSVTNGNKAWITKIFSVSPGNRSGAVVMDYRKAATGNGYECSVTFELNNLDAGVTVVDPDFEIPEEAYNKFDYVLSSFLGWQYDYDSKRLYHAVAFKELRDYLKELVIRSTDPTKIPGAIPPKDETEVYENKNKVNMPF